MQKIRKTKQNGLWSGQRGPKVARLIAGSGRLATMFQNYWRDLGTPHLHSCSSCTVQLTPSVHLAEKGYGFRISDLGSDDQRSIGTQHETVHPSPILILGNYMGR